MSTAASWTDRLDDLVDHQLRAAADVVHLARLRTATGNRARRAAAVAGFTAITVAAAVVPALTPDAGGVGQAFTLLLLVPSAMAGILLLAVASAIASGGGRELVPRDQLVAFPVSPTTDHLGALLLAPFNIAWLIQSWLLLGIGSFAAGPRHAAPLVLGLACWILAATACGQFVAWTVEWVRRLPGGIVVVRSIGIAGVAVLVILQLTHRLSDALDGFWTRLLFVHFLAGGLECALAVVFTLGLFALVVIAGAVPATLAARHMPRDEASAETGHVRPHALGRTDLGMLIRMDRASVWRGVPMRRGIFVLALGPGLVALAGALPWHQLAILPGLVVSGGALLFGVNAWTLEGRGILWRETLPVDPHLVFVARAWVLAEFLLTASAITLALGAIRAGRPDADQLVALICCWVVVILQVVSASLRWSARSPYAVDLRSARATPAPPAAMVGYSARLAVVTTLTGMLFSGLAQVDAWPLSLLVAAPLAGWPLMRLLRQRDHWVDPARRARVVMTVAG